MWGCWGGASWGKFGQLLCEVRNIVSFWVHLNFCQLSFLRSPTVATTEKPFSRNPLPFHYLKSWTHLTSTSFPHGRPLRCLVGEKCLLAGSNNWKPKMRWAHVCLPLFLLSGRNQGCLALRLKANKPKIWYVSLLCFYLYPNKLNISSVPEEVVANISIWGTFSHKTNPEGWKHLLLF